MIGKETGDVVEVNTPGGVKAYEILKVEWAQPLRIWAVSDGRAGNAGPALRLGRGRVASGTCESS